MLLLDVSQVMFAHREHDLRRRSALEFVATTDKRTLARRCNNLVVFIDGDLFTQRYGTHTQIRHHDLFRTVQTQYGKNMHKEKNQRQSEKFQILSRFRSKGSKKTLTFPV